MIEGLVALGALIFGLGSKKVVDELGKGPVNPKDEDDPRNEERRNRFGKSKDK